MTTAISNSDTAQWVKRIRSGDVRALARAISSIENSDAQSLELLKAIFPHSGSARVPGLTGSAGAGNSTLVDQVARLYRKQQNTVSNTAVDPITPYTGRANFGGRIRMQAHHA